MSLPIAWVLQDKPVLLVGGGEVAETRVRKLVGAGTKVTVVAPEITPYIAGLAKDKTLRWFERAYEKGDLKLEHWSMVLTAIDDHETSAKIADACRKRHIPVNVADVPPLCDFYFGANFEQGPLKVMVSTGSAAPGLAKRVLDELAQHAEQIDYAGAILGVQQFRMRLREHMPGTDPATIQTRMRLMKTICDKYTWAELADLNPDDVEPMIKALLPSTDANPTRPAADAGDAKDADRAAKAASEDPVQVPASPRNIQSQSSSEEDGPPLPESAAAPKSAAAFGNAAASSNAASNNAAKSTKQSSVTEGAKQVPKWTPSGRFMPSNMKSKMKITAIECDENYPTPPVPSFPFRKTRPPYRR